MSESGTPSHIDRLMEEMRSYALVSFYLFICFSVLLLNEAALRNDTPNATVQWSLALIKALVLGKFILIGKMLSVGKRADKHPLLHRIFWKSLAMLLLLMMFEVLEEVVVGWFNNKAVAQVTVEFFDRSWVQIVAPLLLMLLILIPLVAVSEVYKIVGKERFNQILTGR